MTHIALVHATPLAMAPIAESFARLWPQAKLTNVLDDGLSRDATRAPQTIPARFEALARYAQLVQADAVLFTCSAFGPAIEAARAAVPLPMLKPNEAMLDEALQTGARITLLATFEPALAPMVAELRDAAAALGREVTWIARHVPHALDALGAGDAGTHDRLIAEAAAALPVHDVLMLAQFSMARALPSVSQRTSAPVLCSPDSAVRRLRQIVG